MSTILLLARLALAATFAVAAAAKLADPRGTRRAAEALGGPAGAVVLLLPVAELAVAGALLVPATAFAGALAALLLLAAFTALLARALRRGRPVACHCFGALSGDAPAGPGTLARNGGLLALAAAIAVGTAAHGDAGPSAVAWVGELRAGEAVALGGAALALAVAAAASVLAGRLLQAHGGALRRVDELEAAMRAAGLGALVDAARTEAEPAIGPPVGSLAPAFALVPAGAGDVRRATLAGLLERGRPVLVAFADPDCGPCRALLPELARWQRDHADDLTIAVLSSGDLAAVAAVAAEHGLADVLLDERAETYAAYAMGGTPGAVLVGVDGRVAAPGAAGADAIAALVDAATGRAVALDVVHAGPADRLDEPVPEGLPVGSAVPAVAADLALGEHVVLFWNAECGFCAAMADDVRAWPADGPPLTVVSRTPDESLGRPVVVDPAGSLAAAFGAGGTPMAVLVRDGVVAAPLAAGGPAVLALAGRAPVAA